MPLSSSKARMEQAAPARWNASAKGSYPPAAAAGAPAAQEAGILTRSVGGTPTTAARSRSADRCSSTAASVSPRPRRPRPPLPRALITRMFRAPGTSAGGRCAAYCASTRSEAVSVRMLPLNLR